MNAAKILSLYDPATGKAPDDGHTVHPPAPRCQTVLRPHSAPLNLLWTFYSDAGLTVAVFSGAALPETAVPGGKLLHGQTLHPSLRWMA
eukprot:1459042-Rhodomonas_salina.2